MSKMITLGMLAIACGCGSVSHDPDARPDDGAGPPDATTAKPVKPIAPTSATPMYQGAQREFRTDQAGTCTGRVAASMAGTGFCFLAADDTVKCAGVIGGVDYGMVPTGIGQSNAEQIMVFFNDNGMCVTKTDHTVWCMGTNTNAFGAGISDTFAQWTTRDDVAEIGSGTWDQICGMTLTGQVYCGGIGNPDFGNPPITVGAPGQTSFWVDPGGVAHLSDTTVLRPAESRTECQVTAGGLICGGMTYNSVGATVVSGTATQPPDTACWLDDSGTARCTDGPRFAVGHVLLLAADYYTDSLCAIYDDGSVWCIGSNANGKLGTGNTATLTAETRVDPPGSAYVHCD